ncbi:MAG: family transcriptional regulator [Paenibacillaceae bacterium]|nr:family transcriptional regulator [Paenibacillaceae bacterium]
MNTFDSPYWNEFGDLLVSWRGKRSLREVSEKTGLSHTYIRDLELGYNRSTKKKLLPSEETLRKLATYYEKPYDYLYSLAYRHLVPDVDTEVQRSKSYKRVVFHSYGIALQIANDSILTRGEISEIINSIEYIIYKKEKDRKGSFYMEEENE